MAEDSLYALLANLEASGQTAALATVVRVRGSVPRHAGTKMLVYPDGRSMGTVGGGEMEGRVIQEALDALKDGGTRILRYELNNPNGGDPGVCGGEMEVFVEPIQRRPTVVVVGAGHVGKAVAHLAHWLGFRVIVADDRAEYANRQAVPEADETIVCSMADLPSRVTLDSSTYVLLTTRGVRVDIPGLPGLMDSSAAYLGVIGSRRRWEVTAQQLRDEGVSEEKIAKVTSPMGLELNAETPEEIAVSMMAEVILRRRGGSGEPMAHPTPRVHTRGS
ncbi:MAG: XdhC family protein [Anaerolineales bacterium]